MTADQLAEDWSPSARELERRGVRRRLRRRGLLISTATLLGVAALVVGLLLASPGWPTVRHYYFDWRFAKGSFHAIAKGFLDYNVRLFLICEPCILVLALLVALARTARAPWLLPVRLLAVVWTDLLRGLPTLLIVALLAFGVPALRLVGLPTSTLFWAGVALVVSYSAYVAEVLRSGIESIHPSQVNSAYALGLTRSQTLRHVVVPQAVRRVVPPLLNDFISLQKDTSLVAFVSVFDGLYAANDYSLYHFNYTSLVVVGCFFVVITIPMARATDWVARRWAARERVGAL